ncbi:MAG TPA: CopG family transcriptional regulator [Caulobacteraceae bacterium]
MPDPFPEDDEELSALLDSMPPMSEEEERLADERAEADIAAGRVVPNDRVVEWLRSWGTDNPLPRPRWDDAPE